MNIYLTFDDGPDPDWTPRILDVLDEAHSQATFFMVGRSAQRHAVLARRVVAAGHAIGNHTFSHRHPWSMRSRAARAEVRDGAAALSDALGITPALFRPPHGRLRPCMAHEAERLGERVMLWDVSAIDWGWLGVHDRISKRLRRVQPGDVVLLHDGRNRHNRPDQLLQVLPAFLAEIRRRGLQCAAIPAEIRFPSPEPQRA